MQIQTRTSALATSSRYQPAATSRAQASPDRFTPSEGPTGLSEPSRVRKALKGMAVGAGLATAACLAVAGTINPLGAIVILCSTVVGGTYAANDGNLQAPDMSDLNDPLNPLNTFNPLSPWYLPPTSPDKHCR